MGNKPHFKMTNKKEDLEHLKQTIFELREITMKIAAVLTSDYLEENRYLRQVIQDTLDNGKIYHHTKKKLKKMGFTIP